MAGACFLFAGMYLWIDIIKTDGNQPGLAIFAGLLLALGIGAMGSAR